MADMRIVLLGNRYAGKSSSGNTILDRQEFGTVERTAICVRRKGVTAARHITVVEAPGWWADSTVEQTPKRDKREIVLSVSLCPPGPHALLLVIKVDASFPETFRRAVQEHMELLGERVWSNTIVLFTIGDWLGDTSIEQHIESGGEALQWVVEKCGNRYHVIDNTKSDDVQVTELLEKIEEMVAGNRGERSMDHPIKFTHSQSENNSRGNSAKGSFKSSSVSELMKRFEPLSTASSTTSSWYGTAQREKAGSAHSSSSMSPHSRLEGRGEITQTTAGQPKPTTKQEHTNVYASSTSPPLSEHARRLETLSTASSTTSFGYGTAQRENGGSADTSSSMSSHSRLGGRGEITQTTAGQPKPTTEQEHTNVYASSTFPPVPELTRCTASSTRSSGYGTAQREKAGSADSSSSVSPLNRLEGRGEIAQTTAGQPNPTTEQEHTTSVTDDQSEDSSRADDVYASSTSPPVSELTQHLATLGTASFTTSFGYGTAGRKKARSADSSSSISPLSRLGERGEITHTTTGQPKPTTEQEHTNAGQDVFIPTISYNKTECIGKGSFGSVYKGSYQGQPAAVKFIDTEGTSVNTNEFMIHRRLSHPNIVQMLASFISPSQILIANEYIDGDNLEQVLHNVTVKVKLQDKLSVALDISMAVEYIHDRGVIHQDLKPANIMVSSGSKRAYLTDWGLANVRQTVMTSKATGRLGVVSGDFGGTPAYMARECLVECEKCSRESDMWSLGITLIEMFTNSKPWLNLNIQEIRKQLYDKKTPDALARLQPPCLDIAKPLLVYEPTSRMSAKDLVILLKKKVKRSS